MTIMRTKKNKLISASITALNIAGLGASAFVTAVELRRNNVRSGELYKLVVAADESGSGVDRALENLQLHVAGHMNASPLPQLGENAPVQLSKSYERAKLAESTRVTSERERVTREGIATCESQFGSSNLVTRSNCIAQYGLAHPVQPEREIIADLYRYDFVSPSWTPDKAGLFLLVSVVLAITLALRIVSRVIASFLIKN